MSLKHELPRPAESLTDRLESMIDRHGLTHVLIGLGLVCHEKAEHLRANWQDRESAKQWYRAGNVCDAAGRRVEVE